MNLAAIFAAWASTYRGRSMLRPYERRRDGDYCGGAKYLWRAQPLLPEALQELDREST